MARSREFDEEVVLDAAMEYFWNWGYEATSVRDLIETTGLTGASLYNAFGDKRGLFRAALDRYVESSIGERIRRCEALPPREAIARFFEDILLPRGFHRIRHYGLLASSARKASIARARELLAVAPPPEPVEVPEPLDWLPPCPCCGGHMTIIETFGRWKQPRAPPHTPASTGSTLS
jgi:AcrR family transcriptional regulator